jgi:transcriptional regulator with XRE-family HTH domain
MTSASPAPTSVAINGYALREIRKRSNVSMGALAEQVAIGEGYMSKIERGLSFRVSAELYAKFIAVLVIEDYRTLLANPHAESLADAS